MYVLQFYQDYTEVIQPDPLQSHKTAQHTRGFFEFPDLFSNVLSSVGIIYIWLCAHLNVLIEYF